MRLLKKHRYLKIGIVVLIIVSMITTSGAYAVSEPITDLNKFLEAVVVGDDDKVLSYQEDDEITLELTFGGNGSTMLGNDVLQYTLPDALDLVSGDKNVDITNGEAIIEDNSVTIEGNKVQVQVNTGDED